MHILLTQLTPAHNGNRYTVTLSTGSTIVVDEKPEYNGNKFLWKVDTQYFTDDLWAAHYLEKLITEKLTGMRIILHKKGEVPDICGINGTACRSPQKCNSAICTSCPVAEAFFAKRDGVKLVYAVNP